MEQQQGQGVDALEVINKLKLTIGNLHGEAAVNATVIETQRDTINSLNQRIAQLESESSNEVLLAEASS